MRPHLVNRHFDFNSELPAIRSKFPGRPPTQKAAVKHANNLNKAYANMLGQTAEIDCGRRYFLDDGEVVADQAVNVSAPAELCLSGLRSATILLRFDVLVLQDKLKSRGTELLIHEPCLVTPNVEKLARNGSLPMISEAYIPLIHLGEVVVLDSLGGRANY
jgi:hypothetical protein